jgi:hypothetical protein
MTALQLGIDVEVLVNERQAAAERVGRLFGRESLRPAVAHTVVLAEVTVDGLEAVISFAGDDVGIFPLGITLPADDAFVRETGAHVVQRGAPRDQGSRLSLVLSQQGSYGGVVGIEQLGQVAIGKKATLSVGLVAQAEHFVKQALRGRDPIDSSLNIVGRAQRKHDGDQLGVGDALAVARRIVAMDGHPHNTAMRNLLFGTQVLLDEFQNHLGADLAEARPDARELDADLMSQSVFQVFVA